jgi:heat shock protein HslJ
VSHILRSGLAALLLAALAAGCSDTPATPTSPTGGSGSLALTAGQLSGSWTLRSMQVAGGAVTAVPGGARYTLSFGDGRVSVRADCNSCSGTYALNGGTITIGPTLACTRAACPTMSLDAAYMNVLSGDATATVTNGALVLESPRGALVFTR